MNTVAVNARLEVEQILKHLAEKDRAWDGRWSIRLFGQGHQAQLYSAQRESGSGAISDEVVVKLYKESSPADRIAFLSERHCLEVLSELLHGHALSGWSMCSPTLYYASDKPLALVMSALPGVTIKRWLKSSQNSATEQASVARAILATLQLLWSRDVMYGDLNLKNILYDPTKQTISFIDPGLPAEFYRCDQVSRDCGPASRDLAYLLFSVAVGAKSALGNPAAWSRQLLFVEMLLRQHLDWIDSSQRQAMLLDEIRLCTQVHVEGLNCSWSPAGLWRRLVKRITQSKLNCAFAQLATPGHGVKP